MFFTPADDTQNKKLLKFKNSKSLIRRNKVGLHLDRRSWHILHISFYNFHMLPLENQGETAASCEEW